MYLSLDVDQWEDSNNSFFVIRKHYKYQFYLMIRYIWVSCLDMNASIVLLYYNEDKMSKNLYPLPNENPNISKQFLIKVEETKT